jgi:hypothetical protein
VSPRKRGAVFERVQYRRSELFYGHSKVLLHHIGRLNIPYQWTLRRDAIMVPSQRAADLEASLVADGHSVHMRLVA